MLIRTDLCAEVLLEEVLPEHEARGVVGGGHIDECRDGTRIIDRRFMMPINCLGAAHKFSASLAAIDKTVPVCLGAP
jgi:hypothetical protein